MNNKLDKIAAKYSEENGFEKVITQFKIREILKYSFGNYVLDMGCGIGLITRELAKKHKFVIGIDGSKNKINKARKYIQQKNIRLLQIYFDDFQPEIKFDTVILANVLEHVEDPVRLLNKIVTWLSTKGRVIATVPNAESLNRKIGLAMGEIKYLKELTKRDREKGHVRIYDKKTLKADFQKAKLQIYHLGGIFLKPFPHALMERIGSPRLYEGLYKMRDEFPYLCSSLIIVGFKQ